MTNEGDYRRDFRRDFAASIGPRSMFLIVSAFVTFWLVEIHRSESIELKIVDARSGIPIPNVLVSVDWEIAKSRLIHGTERYPFQVTELRTNSSGRATIPAWRKPTISFFGSSIAFNEPTIRIIGMGYLPLRVKDIGDNHERIQREFKLISTDYTSPQEELRALNEMGDESSRLGRAVNCAWKKTPAFLADLEVLREQLNNSEIASRIPPLETLGGSTCGNAAAFVKAHELSDQWSTGSSEE